MTNISDQEISSLIGKIYDEVDLGRPWITSLEALRKLIPSNTMALEASVNGERHITYYFAAGRRVEAEDIGVWECRNSEQTEMIELSAGVVVTANDWRKIGAKSDFLFLLEKYDVLRSMSVLVSSVGHVQYSLHAGRSINENAFSENEENLFSMVSAHLSRAIKLRQQLCELSVEEAEEALHISHNTTRSHLRSIFSKTGVSSRADLIRLLINGVAPLAGENSKTRH